MGYADHLRTSTSSRPNCWGNERSYDPHDIECGQCKFRHSCRSEIDRGGIGESAPTHHPAQVRRRNENIDGGNYESGMVGPDERPVERFFKDAAGGLLRGMFYEMYNFWRNYRIR